MILGLDSKPPSDAQIAAAKAAGYGLWALYHGSRGDGIDPAHLASDDDFRRVMAGGLTTLAYVSGNQDPLAIKAWSQATGILAVVDCERFIREDGPWVPGWLAASGAGLYGNGSVHYDSNGFRKAACHVFAGYYGFDPHATWPSWLPHDDSPLAWQFHGTMALFGMGVDLCWFDDSFASRFGPGGGSIGGLSVSGQFQGSTEIEHATYVGADGNFYHGWRNADPPTSTPWTWENLGAPTGKTCADSAEWLADAKVHIQVVRVRTTDGGLWCRYSIVDSSNPAWAAWVPMDNVEPATGSPAASDADVPADLSAVTQAAQNAHDVATKALVAATAAQESAIKVETAVVKAGNALKDLA